MDFIFLWKLIWNLDIPRTPIKLNSGGIILMEKSSQQSTQSGYMTYKKIKTQFADLHRVGKDLFICLMENSIEAFVI